MIFAPSNIKDFLYKPGKYFLIPEFQRPYSWNDENIRSYLDDLEQMAAYPAEKKHYFGSVVFVNDSKDLNAEVIIDGQQRLTTSLLLLLALYHIVCDSPDKSEVSADEIRDKYLFNSASYAAEENRIRLKTVTTDDKIFNKLYHRDELDSIEKQSKLHKAYRQFYEYLSVKNQLDKYINTLAKFDIVTISLNTADDNPQRVFESINSTGQPLSDGDKIRNFALMLGSSEDQEYIYKKYWQKIEEPLADPNEDYITQFFRAYLIAKRGSTVPLGNVYPEFKKQFEANIEPAQPRDQLDSFYGDILHYLEYFLIAKFGDDPKQRFNDIADFFMRMRYLQIEIFFPFAMNVLAAADDGLLDKPVVKNCLKLVEIYFSRRVACNILASGVDKVFASLHRDILDHQSTEHGADYFEVMKYLMLSRGGNSRLPRDQEIDYSIEHNDTYYQRKAHVNYLLASPGDESKESDVLRQIADKKINLTIEHIMPQTLTKDWTIELGNNYQNTHETYLHKLANLTLTGYNSEYSNHSFMQKKTMKDGFDDSPLVINAQLKKLNKWTETELKSRQKWWQDKLKSMWPEPTSNYKPVEVDTKIWLFDKVDLKNTQPRILHLQTDQIPVSTWAEALDLVVERVFDLNESIYEEKIINDAFVSRYIKNDKSAMNAPEQINDSQYYTEMNTDTNTKKRIASTIGLMAGWTREDLAVELAEPLTRQVSATAQEKQAA